MFREAHRDLAIELYDRSRDGVEVDGHDANRKTRRRQTMKMIMTALGTAALLGVAALPARADTEVAELVREVAKAARPALTEIAREPRNLVPEIRFDNDALPFGSREWWQEVERNQPRRR
jgi:hypothetical protein